MIDSEQLIVLLDLNYNVIKNRVQEVSHEASLAQPPAPIGNCLNWILGHIVARRNTMLEVAGVERVWSAEYAARYERDSPPVLLDAADVTNFADVVAAFDRCHELLIDRLQSMSVADLLTPTHDETTIGGKICFLHFHEAYHLGQIDMLMPVVRAAMQIPASVAGTA